MFSTIAAAVVALTLLQPASTAPVIGIAVLPALSTSPSLAAPSNRAGQPSHAPLTNASNRSSLLTSLYVSFAALQMLDVHSTRRAISSGAGRESNPALRGIAGNTAALVAVKAATTGATIWVTEKLRKEHRTAAVVVMAALNSAMAAVVAHNYSLR